MNRNGDDSDANADVATHLLRLVVTVSLRCNVAGNLTMQKKAPFSIEICIDAD